MEIEYSNNSAMDYQQPSSFKAKSGAMSNSSSDLNQIIRFEFKPSVPYDVMEFVHLSPEVFDALSKKFNKVKVELTKKHANTVHGYSMFYVVTFTLPQNKEMREKYRQGMLEFEQNCIKRVLDFFSQLSTKTENFDFINITTVRSDMGWDQDDADLIVVQNDSQEMVQAFVRHGFTHREHNDANKRFLGNNVVHNINYFKTTCLVTRLPALELIRHGFLSCQTLTLVTKDGWDDIIKGDVTVSGYRNQIDDIFKILKKLTLQAQSRASTSSRIRHQHHQREIPSTSHQREIPSSNHQHHSYAFAASQKFQKPGQNGKFVKVNPGLIPWFVKFSTTEAGRLFNEVEMRVTNGGVILIGESSAATRAQHWVSEMAPQLVTDHQKLENDDDFEFLTCDSGKKFLKEVESKTKCSVFVQTKTGQSLSMTHQPQVLMERKLVGYDVIVRVIKVDITEHHCDAIVNASNETLRLLSAGVSGSISKKGGMEIQKEMDQISVNRGRLQPGEAVSTSAGNGSLPCKRIIHAVGPRWRVATNIGTSVRQLQSCIFQSLLLTEVDDSTSIAFPAISCGVFGGKPEMCAGIIVQAITQYFMVHNYSKIKRIDLVDTSDEWVLTQFKLALEPLSTPLKSGTQSTSFFGTGAGQAIATQPKTKQTPLSTHGGMNVTVKQGDITAEASDAIADPFNVAQPVADDTSVDPVKLPLVDVGYDNPGLFFCASKSSEIREAQSIVAHYIKEQSLKAKTYTEKVNLTQEEEMYLRDRIFDVEDRFKVIIEPSITRSGRNAKLIGERDNVKKAMSSLQRDFRINRCPPYTTKKLESHEPSNRTHASKTNQADIKGSPTASEETAKNGDGRRKLRRDASTPKGTKDNTAGFSLLTTTSSLPHSPEVRRITVTPDVTVSASTDDEKKGGQKKLSKNEKRETSHENERSGSDDSDDHFENANFGVSDSETPEQSDKEEPKAEPMQKQDTEVEQEATENEGFTFFNRTGKSSKFEMKDWEGDWGILETNEWLLLDVPETTKKFQIVVNRLVVQPGSKLPKIIQMQQVKNPTLCQKYMTERQKTTTVKMCYYFYPVVEEDLLENLCGLGWNNSANKSDTSDDGEGASFFHRIQHAIKYAWKDHNGSRQVIMADVVLDNIFEVAPLILTVTKNERAYPLYVLTFAS